MSKPRKSRFKPSYPADPIAAIEYAIELADLDAFDRFLSEKPGLIELGNQAGERGQSLLHVAERALIMFELEVETRRKIRERLIALGARYAVDFSPRDEEVLELSRAILPPFRAVAPLPAAELPAVEEARVRLTRLLDQGAVRRTSGSPGRAPGGSLLMEEFAEHREWDLVFAALRGGGDARDEETRGTCLLRLAARQGNVPVVRRLLELGADPNEPRHGVLDELVSAKHAHVDELIVLLMEGGADPTRRAQQRLHTPLQAAMSRNRRAAALMRQSLKARPAQPFVQISKERTGILTLGAVLAEDGDVDFDIVFARAAREVVRNSIHAALPRTKVTVDAANARPPSGRKPVVVLLTLRDCPWCVALPLGFAYDEFRARLAKKIESPIVAAVRNKHGVSLSVYENGEVVTEHNAERPSKKKIDAFAEPYALVLPTFSFELVGAAELQLNLSRKSMDAIEGIDSIT